jgi:hypothetical protein
MGQVNKVVYSTYLEQRVGNTTIPERWRRRLDG